MIFMPKMHQNTFGGRDLPQWGLLTRGGREETERRGVMWAYLSDPSPSRLAHSKAPADATKSARTDAAHRPLEMGNENLPKIILNDTIN